MGIINNKTSLLFTFLVIVVLLIGMTIYKVSEIHLQRSFTVTEKRIIEGAQACVWSDVCKESRITLGTLINLGYVKEEVNPKTKMYYSHESYVEIKDNTYTFVAV